jgi:putative transposase
VLVKINGTTH